MFFQVMGYSDTDVAEYIYTSKPDIESLVNYLCKDLTKACKTKPPPLSKVIGFTILYCSLIILCSVLTNIKRALILYKVDTCYSVGITEPWFKCSRVTQSFLLFSLGY